MNYFLSENELSIKELIRNFTNKRIIPFRRELDEKDDFPKDIFDEMAKLDFFRLIVPEEYGGFGDSLMPFILAIEELSRGDAGVAVSFAVDSILAKGIVLFGNDSQKLKYLPSIADGKKLTAFALTEPEAGSDAGSIKTRAVKKGKKYILNGLKQFITNGEVAELYMVFAVTDPDKGKRGQTAFIVEKGTPGFSFGKKEDKMGIRSSVTKQLFFDNCEIPEENVIGEPGKGFYIALGLVDRSRIGIAAQAVGIAQAAFNEAKNYSRIRKQFNKTINSFQSIQHMLADMATQIEAARLMVYHAARLADANQKELAKISSMAKLFSSNIAMKVTTDAVQILGGYGYIKDYPVEKMMRDAKVTQIYEGTNQIQKNTIANMLIKEDQ